jgi:hypothetical protein
VKVSPRSMSVCGNLMEDIRRNLKQNSWSAFSCFVDYWSYKSVTVSVVVVLFQYFKELLKFMFCVCWLSLIYPQSFTSPPLMQLLTYNLAFVMCWCVPGLSLYQILLIHLQWLTSYCHTNWKLEKMLMWLLSCCFQFYRKLP